MYLVILKGKVGDVLVNVIHPQACGAGLKTRRVTKVADPAVTLASGKLFEVSGDVTAKVKCIRLPQHPVGSKGISWSCVELLKPITIPYLHLNSSVARQQDSTNTS
ncbi:hypothetical protein EMCRGX_G011055 [Ephydatia muelleri]